MKYILMTLSVGIILTSCMSSYQSAKAPVDANKTINDYSQSIGSDSEQVSNIRNHCLYGNCLCEKRLLELPRCLEYNFHNFYSYEPVK